MNGVIGRLVVALTLGLLVSAFGCRSEAPDRRLVVFAASSLREGFEALAVEFERAHPGVDVVLQLAGTQQLRTQIEQGARADVFASADDRHMAALHDARRVVDPVTFAHGEPVLVVTREAAGTVRSFADLPEARRIVLGAPEVPIGRYAEEMLDRAARTLGPDFRARVEQRVVSREFNVRQVLSRLAMGEADAAIVYRTDVAAAGADAVVVPIPPDIVVRADYRIAVVAESKQAELARAWVSATLSESGARRLRSVGFAPVGGAEGPP